MTSFISPLVVHCAVMAGIAVVNKQQSTIYLSCIDIDVMWEVCTRYTSTWC